MKGIVTDTHTAIVEIELQGQYGSRRSVQAVVDTGFSEGLSLPLALLLDLGLFKTGEDYLRLANGELAVIDVYEGASAIIDGVEVAVAVHRSALVLLGMKLMHGRRLTIDVLPGGVVTILRTAAQESPRANSTP